MRRAGSLKVSSIRCRVAMLKDIKKFFLKYTSTDYLIGTPAKQEWIIPSIAISIMEELFALLRSQIKGKYMTHKVIHKVYEPQYVLFNGHYLLVWKVFMNHCGL